MGNLYEREDDWSTATFWYSLDLVGLADGADYALRTADLD